MKPKSYWLSISAFVLMLIWTIYYYAMQYTGGITDLTGTQDTGSHVGYQEKIWKERDLKRIELSGGGNGKREKPTDRGT